MTANTQGEPPWPTAELDALGLKLLTTDTEWIARRKDTVTLIDDRTVHWHLSIDFRVPPEARKHADGDKPVLPLAILKKAPARLTDIDFKDESGRSLPLPTRAQNGSYSAGVLKEAARAALATAEVDIPAPDSTAWHELAEVALLDQRIARTRLAVLTRTNRHLTGEQRAALEDDLDFKWLSELLATHSILAVPPPEGDGRRIYKLSFTEHFVDVSKSATPRRSWLPRAGWKPYMVWLQLPYVGGSAYHLEAKSPRGLEILDGGIRMVTRSNHHTSQRDRPLSQSIHIYLREATGLRGGLGWVAYRVYRGGFISGALIASSIVTGVLFSCILLADEIVDATGTVAGLLLLFPSLMAAYVYDPGRHALAKRLVHLARKAVLFAALLAYIGAARIALLPRDGGASACNLRWTFAALTMLSLLVTFGLWMTKRYPKPYYPD